MSFQERADFGAIVSDLNEYGQKLNKCDDIDEIASITTSAVDSLFDFTRTIVVEVHDETIRVRRDTEGLLAPGDDPIPIAGRAVEAEEPVTATGEEAGFGDDSAVVSGLAMPLAVGDEIVGVLVVGDETEREFGDGVVRPLRILGSHVSTAIKNIRQREQLRYARRDLEQRKEMIEIYHRLVRHDVRNDLTVVSGYATQVAEMVDDGPADYAERIARTAEQSTDLIERVGDLVDSLEQQEGPSPHNLQAVLESAVENARTQHETLSVEFDPEEFDYVVYGGDLLESVFSNIITNAAVHNDQPVDVRITSETPRPDIVVVSIADDGTGIPDDVADRLFQMGVKGEESNGTGFGLGFARALTESYGGGVTVQESDRGGADFRITLERV